MTSRLFSAVCLAGVLFLSATFLGIVAAGAPAGQLAVPESSRTLKAKPQPQAAPAPAGAAGETITGPGSYPGAARDLELARRYAPVFYQRLAGAGHSARFDLITNFDFDSDWAGNNNWENAADPRFPMRAYVYYSVIESGTHYFITYVLFHARDWSPMQPLLGSVLDQVQKSEKYGKYMPPELRQFLEINHENDLEGVQLFVRKAARGAPEVLEAAETVAHDEFHLYLPARSGLSPVRTPHGELRVDGGRPLLYVEALKHGIHAWPYQHQHTLGSVLDVSDGPLLVYRYAGVPGDPEATPPETAGTAGTAPAADPGVGYDLLPLYNTFWERARAVKEPDKTFGLTRDFGDTFCRQIPVLARERMAKDACRLGTVATALRGDYAGRNRALLPWAWSSLLDPQLFAGEWFLNPVAVQRLRFPRAGFSDTYVSNPYLGFMRSEE